MSDDLDALRHDLELAEKSLDNTRKRVRAHRILLERQDHGGVYEDNGGQELFADIMGVREEIQEEHARLVAALGRFDLIHRQCNAILRANTTKTDAFWDKE